MMALPASLALLAPRSKSIVLFAMVFALYFVMIGFRHHVGMDWNNYAAIHFRLRNADIARVFEDVEIGSNLLFWVSSNFFDGQATTNIIAGFMFTAALLHFAWRQSEPWLAITAGTPFLAIVTAMSATRQSLAVAVLLVLIANWKQLGIAGKLAFTLAASLFHLSALAISPLVIASLKTGLLQRILLALLVSLATFLVIGNAPTIVERFNFYTGSYTGYGAVVSQGAFAHVALVAAPALFYLFFKRRLDAVASDRSFLTWSACAVIALLAVTPFASVAGSRLSLYFHHLPAILYPLFVSAAAGGARLALRALFIGWNLLYLWVWLSVSNSGFAWLPYQNSLFQTN